MPGAGGLLDALRARGFRIAFLSDMHFGADELAPVLTRLGLLGADDLLLVSCDEGASKAHQGELYQRLLARTDGPAQRILHVGNSPWADHAMARHCGLKSLLVRTAEPSRYESTLMAAELGGRRDLGSTIAGTARLARLHALEQGDPPPLASVASGVAAPTMIGFAMWLAARADALELDRMVFLSRNGRLPYEAYRRLPRAMTHDRPLSYVTLSRNAVRMASAAVDLDAWIQCGHDTASSFLRLHTQLLPVRRLLTRLNLDPDEVRDGFERNGFSLDRPIGSDRSAEDWRACFDDPDLRAALQRQAEAERSLLVDYLDQNGLLADERIGIVDIGWRGQQAAMMTAVAESASNVHLHHFHLGRDQAESLLYPVRIDRYLFDHDDRPRFDNAVALFEMLAATTEPGMAGLRRTDGSVEPVFREEHDPVRESPHIDPLHRIVIDVVERLADRLRPDHRADDIRARLIRNAHTFWLEPSDDEARYWTSLPYERDASGEGDRHPRRAHPASRRGPHRLRHLARPPVGRRFHFHLTPGDEGPHRGRLSPAQAGPQLTCARPAGRLTGASGATTSGSRPHPGAVAPPTPGTGSTTAVTPAWVQATASIPQAEAAANPSDDQRDGVDRHDHRVGPLVGTQPDHVPRRSRQRVGHVADEEDDEHRARCGVLGSEQGEDRVGGQDRREGEPDRRQRRQADRLVDGALDRRRVTDRVSSGDSARRRPTRGRC